MKTHAFKTVAALVLLMLAASFQTARAETIYFMKIKDIEGESVIEPGAIDVLAWSWGMSNSGSARAGGGGAGKVNVQDLSVTKFVDKASPHLLRACVSGQRIANVELRGVRQGEGKATPYIIYKMKNVLVSSVNSGGSSGETSGSENVSFGFTEIEYTVFDSTGGSTTFKWDLATNKPL